MSRPGVVTVYRWEMLKLRAQKRTYLGLGIVTAVPLIFVVSIALRNGGPNDVAFGRYVHQSGLAVPLVILVFASAFLLPLATALVAGDIVAAEDNNGTLKTILTRSLDRGQIFAGKMLAALTYALIALLLMGTVATVAGSIESGFNGLISLSGTHISAWKALELVYASFGVYLLPMLAIAAIGVLLSTTTRNSAGAVVGTVMVVLMLNLVDIIPGLEFFRPYLLPHQFDAWMGFLREPIDWSPIIRAAWVSAVYAIPCGFAAYLVFLRRDVAGG
ncbi:MAG TPA: ABC transporter permease [Solirubrobacteraceae bacterium]|nr:ABC transporter permease [Solirubrobacteraceae bacterium]